jgi:hypothetical protein
METKIIITKKDDQISIHLPEDVVFMNPETLELNNELKKRGVEIIGFSNQFDRPKRNIVSGIIEKPSRDLCRYSDICKESECTSCKSFRVK